MRRRAKMGLLAAAGLLVVGAGTFALSPLGANALSGQRSAGYFSWSSPLLASQSSRTLSVQADVEGHDDDIGCNPEVLPQVRETRYTVSIRVEIINRPLPAGTGCGSAALSRLPVKIELSAPVGTRTLVDDRDGTRHTLLIADQQPTIRGIPRPFQRRPTSWDEASRRVGQWWRWQAYGEAAQINLDFGPARPLSQLGLSATATKRTSVGRASARIWRQRQGDTTDTTVLWTPSGDRTYHLQVQDQSAHPLSTEEILELARSIS